MQLCMLALPVWNDNCHVLSLLSSIFSSIFYLLIYCVGAVSNWADVISTVIQIRAFPTFLRTTFPKLIAWPQYDYVGAPQHGRKVMHQNGGLSLRNKASMPRRPLLPRLIEYLPCFSVLCDYIRMLTYIILLPWVQKMQRCNFFFCKKFILHKMKIIQKRQIFKILDEKKCKSPPCWVWGMQKYTPMRSASYCKVPHY